MSERARQCEKCGQMFGPYKVIHGWRGCQCGGHAYAWCRDDLADSTGCGHTTLEPPWNDETCKRPSFGFSGR